MRPKFVALMRVDKAGTIWSAPYLIWLGRAWRVGDESRAVRQGEE